MEKLISKNKKLEASNKTKEQQVKRKDDALKIILKHFISQFVMFHGGNLIYFFFIS